MIGYSEHGYSGCYYVDGGRAVSSSDWSVVN